jgi:hypothetical protein
LLALGILCDLISIANPQRSLSKESNTPSDLSCVFDNVL